jgi:multicomponent Na+:H+ antiporter subunit B
MRGPQSVIFSTVIRFTFFIINIFAIYMLLRGHNYPGGGFIGGLIAAISLILLGLAVGIESLYRIIRVDPVMIAAAGLLLAVATALAPVFWGRPFLEHYNFHVPLPAIGELHVGTPLAFDTGVYLVVVGITSKIIFVLAKSTQAARVLEPDRQWRYSIRDVERPIEDLPAAEKLEPEGEREI